MTYTTLPEPSITYHHSALSPTLLRVESVCPKGSLRITEYQNRRPVIEVDGDQSKARAKFLYVCWSLRMYLDHFFMVDLNTLKPLGLFEIDLRRDSYRALLADCDKHQYRMLVFGKHDNMRIRADLEETHARLAELFQIHYGH